MQPWARSTTGIGNEETKRVPVACRKSTLIARYLEMTKRAPHTKTANPRRTIPSRAVLPERQSSLGAHVCVQREATGPGVQPSAPSLVREVLNSPGQPLDAETRSYMEPRFGHDFSGVRVHTDEPAAKSAGAISAKAYTAGRHIAFASRRYAPKTSEGQTLLAHELVHVVQQASRPVTGMPISPGMKVSTENDTFEQSASVQTRNLLSGASSPPRETQNEPGSSEPPREDIHL